MEHLNASESVCPFGSRVPSNPAVHAVRDVRPRRAVQSRPTGSVCGEGGRWSGASEGLRVRSRTAPAAPLLCTASARGPAVRVTA